MKPSKKIPHFKNEDEERRFWEKHDAAEYLDFKKGDRASFANLRPTTKSISIRLPVSLMDRIKALANKRDIPYQSLIKLYLAQAVEAEAAARK